MAAAGDIRNPCVAIPADIMFSPHRASLYSSMVSLLVRNPYYISRIVYNVKYHECDALLSIILNSLFGDVAHEPSLISLFNVSTVGKLARMLMHTKDQHEFPFSDSGSWRESLVSCLFVQEC
ncbi:hypothetical protein IWW41_005490 [Coemansia sp. RSA 2522]|nr:hypothetical protein IWW41_005490 [Coemansia sp. RSA 2522]